jgi:mono/diheme cytochrome c family protein
MFARIAKVRFFMLRFAYIILILFILSLAGFLGVSAQDTASEKQDEILERGEYIVHIAGCFACHSPYKEEFADFSALTSEQTLTLSLFAVQTLDLENRFMAGGRPFELGPIGTLYSANLTPHEATGIGSWTDAQIELAIRVGVNPSGRRLYPIMPYANYFNMAQSDVEAVIAYLRTIEPVENGVDRSGPSGEGVAPELERTEDMLQTPPDGSDPVELGSYLVNVIMSCNDCHTPRDPRTGLHDEELAMAGGQAYEGPWGIVYGGNITPHEETGIGTWTADDIRRVFREGVRPDGRRLVLMPWEDYASITDDDLDALIAYLQAIEPIDNEIPAPSIDEAFLQYADED